MHLPYFDYMDAQVSPTVYKPHILNLLHPKERCSRRTMYLVESYAGSLVHLPLLLTVDSDQYVTRKGHLRCQIPINDLL